jgi:hypothetical protein
MTGPLCARPFPWDEQSSSFAFVIRDIRDIQYNAINVNVFHNFLLLPLTVNDRDLSYSISPPCPPFSPQMI